MIIGYINNNKKNVDAEAQRQTISEYAQANGLTIDTFYTSDNVSQLAECLQTGGHDVLFANIVSVGGTLAQIKDNLQILFAKGLKIISINENIQLNSGDINILDGLKIATDIMNSIISITSKQALAYKKAQGCKLGRAGHKNKKYVWSGKEEEIKQKLLAGMTRRQVAQDTGMSIFSLYNYINQTPELKQALEAVRNA